MRDRDTRPVPAQVARSPGADQGRRSGLRGRPGVSPGADGQEDVTQLPALVGEKVVESLGPLGVGALDDDLVAGQAAEAQGQDLAGYAELGVQRLERVPMNRSRRISAVHGSPSTATVRAIEPITRASSTSSAPTTTSSASRPSLSCC